MQYTPSRKIMAGAADKARMYFFLLFFCALVLPGMAKTTISAKAEIALN